MAHLRCESRPVPAVTHDATRQTVTLHAYPLTLTYQRDEASRIVDEMVAALARLAVAGAPIVLAEVSEA